MKKFFLDYVSSFFSKILNYFWFLLLKILDYFYSMFFISTSFLSKSLFFTKLSLSLCVLKETCDKSLEPFLMVYKKITKPFVALPVNSLASQAQTGAKSSFKNLFMIFTIINQFAIIRIYFSVVFGSNFLKITTFKMGLIMSLMVFILFLIMVFFLGILYLVSFTDHHKGKEGISNYIIALFLVIMVLTFFLTILILFLVWFLMS